MSTFEQLPNKDYVVRLTSKTKENSILDRERCFLFVASFPTGANGQQYVKPTYKVNEAWRFTKPCAEEALDTVREHGYEGYIEIPERLLCRKYSRGSTKESYKPEQVGRTLIITDSKRPNLAINEDGQWRPHQHGLLVFKGVQLLRFETLEEAWEYIELRQLWND